MKKFEDFKKYLDGKKVTVDEGVLSALELYHEWLMKEGISIDGLEMQNAVAKALKEHHMRTGQGIF